MIWFSVFAFAAASLLFALSLKHQVILAVILVFFTPILSGMPRGVFVPLFRPNELLLLGIISLYVLRSVFIRHLRNDSINSFNFVDKGFLILFLGTGVIPIIKTLYVSRSFSFSDIFPYLSVIQYFLLYKIMIGTVVSKKDLRMVLYAFIVSGMIVSFLAILEAFHVKFVEELLFEFYPSAHLEKTLNYNRITSILGNWAALATFSAIQIQFSLLMFFSKLSN